MGVKKDTFCMKNITPILEVELFNIKNVFNCSIMNANEGNSQQYLKTF